jgi:hypothetical protein
MVEVQTDELGRAMYRLSEDGVRLGNMLAMVDGEDADLVLEALLSRGSGSRRCNPSTRDRLNGG